MASSKWLAQYRGSLHPTPTVEHQLLCCEVNAAARSALLAAGFKGVGNGTEPTHYIYCVFKLARDRGNPRCLFNLYLSLEGSTLRQKWIAKQVTRGLKKSLLSRKTPQFVIRCRRQSEFQWCLDDADLDEYWLMEAAHLLRMTLKDVEDAI